MRPPVGLGLLLSLAITLTPLTDRPAGGDERAIETPIQAYLDNTEAFGGVVVRGQNLPGQQFGEEEFDPFDILSPTEEVTDRVGSASQILANVSRGASLQVTGDADLGGRIQKSNSAPSVGFQRRSPIAQSPYIRGFKGGQIYTQADGQRWFPVRADLDSMLSKIDPTLVDDIVFINGPYGVRYGPGFSFIDVVTVSALANQYDGHESHARVGFSTHTNGGQANGTVTAWGGNTNWGYVVSYGNRTGADYRPGGNSIYPRIPASYHLQNFLGQFGLRLGPDSQIEFRYQRLDQTDSEYAGQFFDLDLLVTDAWSAKYTHQDSCNCSKLEIEGWYNRSPYLGDTRRPGKRGTATSTGPGSFFVGPPVFSVIDRVEAALDAAAGQPFGTTRFEGETNGDLLSAGARIVKTYGEAGGAQLSTGADVRYLQQSIEERFNVTFNPLINNFTTGMPQSELVDPGVFAEVSLPLLPYLNSAIGGRLDWVRTSSQGAAANDTLWAFYQQNEIDLSQRWSANFSFGYAERPPTLIERYAQAVFLGVIQSGFSRVIGTPTLRPERMWQLDLALRADFEWWRASLSGYYAWIRDYATYIGAPVPDPTGARLLRSFNASLATLAGFELRSECDVTRRLSTIGTLIFIDGRDRQIDRPLSSIIPMEGRVALRWIDDRGGSLWGTELGVRIVDNQDQTGSLRLGNTNVTGIDDNFEQPTPGFTTLYLRGVENLTDRTYLEHLNLRLPSGTSAGVSTVTFAESPVLSPGITPYVGVEWRR